VPLLLDLGYTPLNIPNDFAEWAVPHLGVLPQRQADPDGYYDGSEQFVWFDRRTFDYTIESLADVAAQFPGEVWPLVPFDPRRPDALAKVRQAVDQMGFVGVKLYSRCGWMPWNNALIHGSAKGSVMDQRLQGLYDYATQQDLPILNHTSPTGFPPNFALALPRQYHNGSGFAPNLPAPPRPTGSSARDTFLNWCRGWARVGCVQAANYCHYVQNTVSPYAWTQVLSRWPNLRLNFAHTGSQLSLIANYSDLYTLVRRDPLFHRPKHELSQNPMVASGALFRDPLFRECAEDAAVELAVKQSMNFVQQSVGNAPFYGVECHSILFGYASLCTPDMVFPSTEEIEAEVRRAVAAELVLPEWQAWMADWAQRYPVNWLAKIREFQSRHANVYSDLAYISGEGATAFRDILLRLSREAVNDDTLRRKVMIGTDWFMTEMDDMDAAAFWRRIMSVVDQNHPLWERWATLNALEYLNLGPRLRSMENWYATRRPGAPLPRWWSRLRRFYQTPRG
jgi:hypothetical protein